MHKAILRWWWAGLWLYQYLKETLSFRGSSVVKKKNPPANAGDAGSIPGLGRSPGEGNSNPLQYSCLGNPMDREGWRAIVHNITKESDIISDSTTTTTTTKESL